MLAMKLLEIQGLSILGVHFCSPFFGSPRNVEKWRKIYDLDLVQRDISISFVQMLVRGPAHGFGKTLNPCMDCKILMLSAAREMLEKTGARFLATGEVIGQRPMSQRRDALNIIRRDAGVGEVLLRPLCAHHCNPTVFEESGLVDRGRLRGFSGRNRTQQLGLAAELKLDNLPSPAGGCVLTEQENARRYWPVLKKWRSAGEPANWEECVDDFRLARLGRQFWRKDSDAWLCVGRKQEDNEALLSIAGSKDLTLKLLGFPGPIALCRNGSSWERSWIEEAAQILAAHSTKALRAGAPVEASVFGSQFRSVVRIKPDRLENLWTLPDWETSRKEIRSR